MREDAEHEASDKLDIRRFAWIIGSVNSWQVANKCPRGDDTDHIPERAVGRTPRIEGIETFSPDQPEQDPRAGTDWR